MERIAALIEKLHQQQLQNASTEQLLITVQLLQSELQQVQQNKRSLGTPRVAVTLPASRQPVDAPVQTKTIEPVVEVQKPAYVAEEKLVVPEMPSPYMPQKKQSAEPTLVKKEIPVAVAQPGLFAGFDAEEIPTLVQQASKKEIHEVVGTVSESLNDRLKEQKVELVHKLKEAPIKDLRKAIGINDRFSFINELFRGDEAMYERSIKTINNFNIFSEAEFWMRRELRLKLAWDDDHATVQHFYDLVRRRFS